MGAEGGLFWRLSLAESLPNGMISSGKRSELSAPSSTHFLDAGVCNFLPKMLYLSEAEEPALIGPVSRQPGGQAHQCLGGELPRLAAVNDGRDDVGRQPSEA